MSKVNNEVERRLKEIEKFVKGIENVCECLHEDIEDVSDCSGMYMIERRFDKIKDIAGIAYQYSLNTEDEFGEE